MLYGEFAELHSRTPRQLNFESAGLQQLDKEFIEYGNTVLDMFKGNATERNVTESAQAYLNLINRNIDEVSCVLDPHELNNKPSTPELGAISSFLIHSIGSMSYMASDLRVNAGRAYDPKQAFNLAQLTIASAGVSILKDRDELAQEKFKSSHMPYKLFSEYFKTYRSISAGMGHELDSLLLLLEMTRRYPELKILPAPPQFERANVKGKSNKNIDIIVINTQLKQAAGIQVKSTVTARTEETYDTTTLGLLSGTRDLKSTRLLRMHPTSSDYTQVEWPGQIASHRLHNLIRSPNGKAIPFYMRRLLLEQFKYADKFAAQLPNNFQASYCTAESLVRSLLDIAEPEPRTPRIHTQKKKRRK